MFRRKKTAVSGSTTKKDIKKQGPIKKITRKKRGATKNYYFNSDTQKAIVSYQCCTGSLPEDVKERNKIYNETIRPAFTKLAENLINIYKFSSLHDNYNDLKQDCETFLFETINKFDNSRGTNAFSYFNIVCKNFLTIKTKQKSLKTKQNISMDMPETLTNADIKAIEEYQTLPAQDEAIDTTTISNETVALLNKIKEEARTDQEKICISSIITIFENVDQLDLLQKNAVMLYLRELSLLSPKKLTSALQNIKKIYRRNKKSQESEE